MFVYVYLIHVIQQKLIQHCKAVIPQLKINLTKKQDCLLENRIGLIYI